MPSKKERVRSISIPLVILNPALVILSNGEGSRIPIRVTLSHTFVTLSLSKGLAVPSITVRSNFPAQPVSTFMVIDWSLYQPLTSVRKYANMTGSNGAKNPCCLLPRTSRRSSSP